MALDREDLVRQDREFRAALMIGALASLGGVLLALGSKSATTTRIVLASQSVLVLAFLVLFFVLRARRRLVRAVAALEGAEQRFAGLVGSSVDIIAVVSAEGLVTYVSQAVTRMLGYELESPVGQTVSSFVHPDDLDEVVAGLGALGSEVNEREPRRVRIRAVDGLYHWVEVISSNMLDDTVIQGYVLNVRDISERIDSEAVLRESEERFRSAFDGAPIGMALVAPDGSFLRVNQALGDMLGHTETSLLAARAADLVHPDDRAVIGDALASIADGSLALHRAETRYLRDDGRVVWAIHTAAAVRDAEGQLLYSTVQVMDVTEQREAAERLEHQALHDPLTGLPNRALFLDRLEHALERTQRSALGVAVLFLDLDRFKVVNDSLGHGAGDDLLNEVAQRLRAVVRPLDTVARFGGDEFTVLIEDVVDEEQATIVAERIGEAISEPFDLHGSEVFVNTSIGIALSSVLDVDPETLVRDADAAMYRAKERGRARYEVFDERVRHSVVERLSMESALHRALARGEFELVYQPEVDLRTGRIIGIEALLRWKHADRGVLKPGHFITVAEETGLIVPIGAWVLHEACRQAERWRTAGAGNGHPNEVPAVWVNLSARQLSHPGLRDALADALVETGAPPGSICLEITESVLMGDAAATIETLESLRDLGVRLGVDDFGTGYSSLVYLKRFPVDVLKIDRTFVDGLGRESDDTAIVAAVIGLAHSLGLTAVAEGVETAFQVAELRTLGCDVGQGYFFAEPQPADVIDALLGRPLLAGTLLSGGGPDLIDLRAQELHI